VLQKKYRILPIFLLVTTFHVIYGKTFITNGPCGRARFGHNLYLYLRAKLVSHATGVPYLYTPFIHSELLHLHHTEKRCPSEKYFAYVTRVKKINHVKSVAAKHRQQNALCVVKYKTDMDIFEAPEAFREKMRELLRPNFSVTKIAIPKDITATVAIHIRRGDVVKMPDYKGKKFFENDHYISALCKLLETLDDQQVYIHLYTDDPNPSALAAHYEAVVASRYRKNNASPGSGLRDQNDTLVGKKNLIFGWNNPEQTPKNIVSDMWNMAEFDYLIYPPASSFSRIASFIGRHKQVVILYDPNEKRQALPPLHNRPEVIPYWLPKT